MSEVLEFTHEEQSVVNVLTRGAWTNPISLAQLKDHLTTIDKTAWTIIKHNFVSAWKEASLAILDAVTKSDWVWYDTRALAMMLLTLPGWNTLQGNLGK